MGRKAIGKENILEWFVNRVERPETFRPVFMPVGRREGGMNGGRLFRMWTKIKR